MSAGAGPAPRMRGDAGFAAGRAAMLLTAAFVVGVALLHSFDKGRDPYEQSLRTAVRRTTSTTTHTAVASATTTTTPVHQPADVKVLVANGTAIAGAATKIGAELQRGGYNVLSPVTGRQGVQGSVVQYAPGYDADGAAIARVLGLADNAVQPLSTPPLVNDQRGANIVVIVGPDLVNQAGGGGATTATTTGNTTTTLRRTVPTFGRTTTTLGRTATTTASRVTPTTASG